ncbi:unnamed protein product [Strongylus vulgaris]|uniref:Acyltransferase 3 domain-containing protein n=1 Tax=Strongylus vulgaris TaxID=40348 RepID=A0A3P7JAG4_STRVU|nr:unnamed protein product [Strongylus vulgaris]
MTSAANERNITFVMEETPSSDAIQAECQSRAMAFRDDLQRIRAIAIVSVLLFHFYPGLFPNGYIGVDQ